MLSRKAGVAHFHVGDGEARLKLLRQLIDEFHTPPETIYPTHIERSENVLVLDRKTLELKEVIARGRRLVKDGKVAAVEAFIEDSNRSIHLVGKKAQD